MTDSRYGVSLARGGKTAWYVGPSRGSVLGKKTFDGTSLNPVVWTVKIEKLGSGVGIGKYMKILGKFRNNFCEFSCF